MALTGLWLNRHDYQVRDPETNRVEIVVIPTCDPLGNPVYEPSELKELEHFARERVGAGWKKEGSKSLTKDQRKDLGSTLNEIHKSHLLWAETGKGRYY